MAIFSYNNLALKEQREKRRTEKAVNRKVATSRAVRSAQIRTNWDPYRHKSSYIQPQTVTKTTLTEDRKCLDNCSSSNKIIHSQGVLVQPGNKCKNSKNSKISFTDRLKALSQQIESKNQREFQEPHDCMKKSVKISVIKSTDINCKCGCSYAYASEIINPPMDQSEPTMPSPNYAASPSSGYDTNSDSSVHSACDSSPTHAYATSDYDNDDIDVESI